MAEPISIDPPQSAQLNLSGDNIRLPRTEFTVNLNNPLDNGIFEKSILEIALIQDGNEATVAFDSLGELGFESGSGGGSVSLTVYSETDSSGIVGEYDTYEGITPGEVTVKARVWDDFVNRVKQEATATMILTANFPTPVDVRIAEVNPQQPAEGESQTAVEMIAESPVPFGTTATIQVTAQTLPDRTRYHSHTFQESIAGTVNVGSPNEDELMTTVPIQQGANGIRVCAEITEISE